MFPNLGSLVLEPFSGPCRLLLSFSQKLVFPGLDAHVSLQHLLAPHIKSTARFAAFLVLDDEHFFLLQLVFLDFSELVVVYPSVRVQDLRGEWRVRASVFNLIDGQHRPAVVPLGLGPLQRIVAFDLDMEVFSCQHFGVLQRSFELVI